MDPYGWLTEMVTNELKRLVPYGATPKQCAVLPNLRELANPPEGWKLIATGHAVCKHLRRGIHTFEATEFEHGHFSVAQARTACNILLGFEKSRLYANDRRSEALKALGLHYTIQDWRKNKEWLFLYMLAEHLTKAVPDRGPNLGLVDPAA